MLQILTKLNNLQRVSRKVDPSTLVAVPGIWGVLQDDGSLAGVTADTPPTLSKIIVSLSSDNDYESHDVEVGRVTTLESMGVSIEIDTDGYTGAVSQGSKMAVSDKTGSLGKLFDINVTPNGESGTYEIVARCEQVNSDGTIVISTLSPTLEAMTAHESASESPSESPSESTSNSPSESPSESPSNSPSESPSNSPSESASESPSNSPSESPSESPSASPS